MTTLTINIPDEIKKNAKKIAAEDGTTLTYVITQFLTGYQCGKFKLELIEKDSEEEKFDPTKDPDYMIFERDPELSKLSNELGKALDEKFKNETFPSLEEQLKDI